MSHTIPTRAEVARETTWDLDSIFPDLDAWEAAFTAAEAWFPDIAAFAGRLAEGPHVVADALETLAKVQIRTIHVALHARLSYAVDTGDMAAAARSDRSGALYARFAATAAYLEPELLAIGADTLSAWAQSEPRLATYAHYFDRLGKRAPHIRSAEVEAVLVRAGEAFGAGRIHSAITDTDLTFAPATGGDGEVREIGQGTIGKLLTDADREVRRTAWENYADAHLALKNGLAACLSTGVKQNVFNARVRGYESALHASLTPNFIPVAVFEALIDAFQRHLPTWHRYWGLRRRALGLDTLAPWDVKAPLGEGGPTIPYREAVDWIAEGMAPLGAEYVEILRRGCGDERWVDVYPNKGKRMGAFSSGTYGTRPFILMSYNDDVFSLSTLAHELGHSLHSHYSRVHQPPHYAGYGLFVAEVASNFDQAMVRSHLLERFADDRAMQIALIEEAMSNFHRYFFVMPTLARFEREIHDTVWRGGALTSDSLTERMADLFAEAFGPEVDLSGESRARVGSTWMQFSTHLYANFYVYQYATGIAGAHALADKVLAEGLPAAEAYLGFLKAGGSKYPLDALRDAGVDLTRREPVESAFAVMAGYVDRLEALLG